MEIQPQLTNETGDDYVSLTQLLTPQEDSFALGVIEYGGNLRAAYVSAFGDQVPNPTARAKQLMSRPEIAARVQELNGTVKQASLISLESHLIELAGIRDMAKMIGSVKVALNAEELRGKAAGIYVGKSDVAQPTVQVDHLEGLASRLVSLQRKHTNQGAVDVEAKATEVPAQA